MTVDVKKDTKESTKKEAPKKGVPSKKSKVEINPLRISMTPNYATEASDIDLLKTIIENSIAVNYNLTESEKSSLEYKSNKHSVPFDVLESIFKTIVSESNNNQKAFSYVNSVIAGGTISDYLVMSKS